MAAPVDITGLQFGRLTAMALVSSSRQGNVWSFKCECGKSITTRASAARSGKTKSCGCLQKERAVSSAKLARAAKAASAPSIENRFWSKVDRRGHDECWPWTACVRNKDEGYGAFFFEGTHHPSAWMAIFLTSGERPAPGLVACHSCDNPPCCNPNHLFLGTPIQNNDDKVAKRRHAFGERVATAKLTEAQAREIKQAKPAVRCPPGYRIALAKKYGVSPATITDVWGRRWTHI